MTHLDHVLSSSTIEVDPELDCELAFVSAQERLSLSLRDGRLRHGASGSGRAPVVSIDLGGLGIEDVLTGRVTTRDAFGESVLEADALRRPALPAPECEVAPEAVFETIPGASMEVGYAVGSTIFGEVGIAERWLDGVLVESELVSTSRLAESRFDVRVWCSLAELAALRRRELTPLDAIAAGLGIRADWPELMCFFELLQHPAYAAAWPAGRGADAEIAWGAIFCSSGYGAAVQAALFGAEAVVS